MPSDLARTLFPVELKVQITKIKITHLRAIEDISFTYELFADSVRVVSVFERECLLMEK